MSAVKAASRPAWSILRGAAAPGQLVVRGHRLLAVTGEEVPQLLLIIFGSGVGAQLVLPLRLAVQESRECLLVRDGLLMIT
jgi:hypothetical protein